MSFVESIECKVQTMITKRLAIRLGIVCVIVGLLALASSMFREDWDGRFPAGEFRVVVQDVEGRPVPGALLRRYSSDVPSPTDVSGRIVVINDSGGVRFGGSRWDLFWVIPMGDQPPEYIWEVTADGFRRHRVRWSELNSAPQSKVQPTAVHEFRDRKVELQVFDVVVTLKR